MARKSDISSTDLIISMNDIKDDDLEDGEIEDDDEPIVIETPKQQHRQPHQQPQQKTNNLTNDILPEKIIDNIKIQSINKKDKRNNFNRASIIEDDWAGNVENAIAMALKKDGIETTSSVTISADNAKKIANKSDDDERRKSKKRKKRDNEREKRKKRHKPDNELEIPEDDLEDYEMLCIRGGSPPPYSGQILRHEEQESYESSSSYDSYDSNELPRRYEDRRQRRHIKDRRLIRKRDKRRPGHVDSDNEDLRHECRPNRKMELCKFYLMECCAKRDKCLYMHSDFPCKYYYLGIKCVMKDNCKFAHGKPLSDNLRTILLKHLETAPKEILGDFPRLSRDNAIKMLDTTHIKLLVDFGIKPMQNNNQQSQTLISTNINNKIPSLLEIITKPPNANEKNNEKDKMAITTALIGINKTDKPRRTRWCTQGTNNNNNTKQPVSTSIQIQPAAIIPPPTIPLSTLPPSSSANYLSLKNLTGVITSIQIQKLEAIGIENLDQINQLTVAQLNELGLSISQINDIQLNALNIKKLGLSTTTVANTPILSAVINKPQQLITNLTQEQHKTVTIPNVGGLPPFFCEIGTGGQDLDMRINPGQLNPVIDIGLGMQDVDMRVLPSIGVLQQQQTNFLPKISDNVNDLLDSTPTITSPTQTDTNEPCVIDYNNFFPKTKSVVDYTQYLKDSNIENILLDSNGNDSDDQNQLKIEDFNELSHNSIHEDDEELQIDESWCPSDDENNRSDQNDKDNDETFDENKKMVLEAMDDDVIENDDDSSSKNGSSNDAATSNDNHDIDHRIINDKEKKGNIESIKTTETENLNDNKDEIQQSMTATPSYAASLLPAIIEPVTINKFDLNLTNKLGNLSKIDVSTSVAQMLQKSRDNYNQNNSKIDGDSILNNNNKNLEPTKESRDPRLSRDPRTASAPVSAVATAAVPSIGNESRDPRNTFEYYTKNTSEPSSSSTVTSASTLTTSTTTSSLSSSISSTLLPEPDTNRKLRRTIYDSSNMDEDEDNSSKKSDKDMRIQPYFIDTESTNGDIDFRLPFKPIMANYVPATEIDASITSHSPIEYKVVEIDIPRPDFREIRRSIPNQESVLDPRLRRIFSMTEDLDGDCKQQQSTSGTFQSNLPSDIRSVRFDPRRVKEESQKLNLLSSTSPSLIATGGTLSATTGKTNTLDIHLLLQKSLWYKDLSSKQKIMVNRHLAEFSSELKKFHQDTNPDKIFDTTIVTSNQFMQQILLNLGVVINENGQFSLTTYDDDINLIQQQQQANGLIGMSHVIQQPNMLSINNIPLDMKLGLNFVAGMRSHLSIPRNIVPSGIGGNVTGNNGNNFPMNINNFPQRFIDNRPGLLGIAPNIPFNFDGSRPNNNYNIFDEQQQQNQLYNNMDNFDDTSGVGGTSGNNFSQNFNPGNMFENNASGGGGYNNSGNYSSGRSEGRGRNYRGGRVNGGGGNGSGNNSGDRWRNMGSSHGNSSGSGRNSSSRRNNNNYDRDRDNRRDKSKN